MTGVQPYVILLDYDAEVATDEEKESYTLDYYEKNIEIDNAFLYIYFAEEDADNDVGYMCYAVGEDAASVMDSEAVEIFWNYIDRYWPSSLSTDEMFAEVFTDTADAIMPSGTGTGMLRSVVIVLAVIAVIAAAVILMSKKRGNGTGSDTTEVSDYLGNNGS